VIYISEILKLFYVLKSILERNSIFHYKKNVLIISLLLSGFLIDQITTRIGLTFENVYEKNTTTIALLNNNIWLPVDLSLTLLLMIIPVKINEIYQDKIVNLFYVFPLICGLIRLYTCTQNVLILLKIF
jgi:hypothetical protein